MQWRWASVVETLRAILDLEPVLKLGLSKENFLRGSSDAGLQDLEEAGDDPEQTAIKEQIVSLNKSAVLIKDEGVWACWKVMLALQECLAGIESIVNSCPCHFETELLHPGTLQHRQLAGSATGTCPMSGCWAPEIATGLLDEYIKQFLKGQHISALLVASAQVVSQREGLLQAWSQAQQIILAHITQKTEYFHNLPHVLAGLAAHIPARATACAKECLRLFDLAERVGGGDHCHHRLTRVFLESPQFRPHVEAMAQGELLRDCPEHFRVWAARARCWTVLERTIESKHAELNRNVGKATHFSSAHVSVQLRLPDVVQTLESQPDVVTELIQRLDSVRTPSACLQALNLAGHPLVLLQLRGEQQNRVTHKLAKTIIYRADVETQYMPHVGNQQLLHDFKTSWHRSARLARQAAAALNLKPPRASRLPLPVVMDHLRTAAGDSGSVYALQFPRHLSRLEEVFRTMSSVLSSHLVQSVVPSRVQELENPMMLEMEEGDFDSEAVTVTATDLLPSLTSLQSLQQVFFKVTQWRPSLQKYARMSTTSGDITKDMLTVTIHKELELPDRSEGAVVARQVAIAPTTFKVEGMVEERGSSVVILDFAKLHAENLLQLVRRWDLRGIAACSGLQTHVGDQQHLPVMVSKRGCGIRTDFKLVFACST